MHPEVPNMRNLLLLFCFLLVWAPGWAQDLQSVETPGNLLRFELGEIRVPDKTQWKSKVQGNLKIYVGTNPAEVTSLYMVTVMNKPMVLGPDPAKQIQEFAEGMGESFASHQGGLDGPVESKPDARGGSLSFKTKGGSIVYGQLIMAEKDTLVFCTQNGTRQQLDTLVAGFKPDASKMGQPASQKEVRQKLITGFALGCMIINAFLGVVGGLVAMALRGNFWRGAANTMAALGSLELIGSLYFVTKNTGGSSFEQGEMTGYLLGSMFFAVGLPVVVSGFLGRKKPQG